MSSSSSKEGKSHDFGGYILAAAVAHSHMVQYLDDLLTAKWNNGLVELANRFNEIGKAPRDLKPDVLPHLYRGNQMTPLLELDQVGRLEVGDIMAFLTRTENNC